MNARESNFIQLYFEMMAENIEEISEQLIATGINPEESKNRVLNLIKEQKAELKIERGKELQLRVEEIVKASNAEPAQKVNEPRYALAARKLGKLDEEDINNIKKDGALLEQIGKLINRGKDDTGKVSR